MTDAHKHCLVIGKTLVVGQVHNESDSHHTHVLSILIGLDSDSQAVVMTQSELLSSDCTKQTTEN